MNLLIITPTAGRPEAMRLAERWVAQQTRPPDEWIVVDGGETPAELTRGQWHIRLPSAPGWKNYCDNVAAAVDQARGDIVAIIEDDDYYAPGHLAEIERRLERCTITGCRVIRYYHLPTRKWLSVAGPMAPLAQTAFRRAEWGDVLSDCCLRLRGMGDYKGDRKPQHTVDGLFWQTARRRGGIGGHWHLYTEPVTVLGIKGMPGTANVSVTRQPSSLWGVDADLSRFRRWLGADAAAYEPFLGGA